MRDIRESCEMLMSFLPWLLFLFLAGHTLSSLSLAILVALVASIVLGWDDLKRGLILPWATVLFFAFCAVSVNLAGLVWVAKNMELLAKGVLTSIMWFTLLVGQPFVLQYARRDLPKERWHEPRLLQACRFLTLVWAGLMSLSVALAFLRRSGLVKLPEWVYLDASILIVVSGLIYTTLFKRQSRRQHAKAMVRRPN